MTYLLAFIFAVSTAQAIDPQRLKEREEAMEFILAWTADPSRGAGRRPHRTDFNTGEFPVRYDKLVGMGFYSPGLGGASQALFRTPQEFWLALAELAQARGVSLSFFDVPPNRLSAKLRQIVVEELNGSVLEWIRTHNRLPTRWDFGHQPEKIPYCYLRLAGLSGHAEKGLFANIQTFWLQFYAYARQNGYPMRLLDVHFSGELTPEIRTALQNEAMDEFIQWLRNTGRTFSRKSFEEADVPVSYSRLFRPLKQNSRKPDSGRLFLSFAQFKNALNERLAEERCASVFKPSGP